jgi:hypothetical protein
MDQTQQIPWNVCKRLVHNITLNSLHNIGIRIVFPSKIYSFKILFTPGDLFRFKPLIQVSISFSVKGLSNSSNTHSMVSVVYRRQTTDDGRQVMAIVHLDRWSRWTNKQGNMFNSMRTSNPKRFYGKFKKRSPIIPGSDWCIISR